MSMQDRPRGGQSGLEDAVRRSTATGVLALDGRNLSSLPEDLVRGPQPQRGRKHGADAATTTVSFESGSGGWWQVEPISKLSLSRNALARLPSCIVQDCFETLVHLDVSYNQLCALPDALHHCSALKYVNCAHNLLEAMPASGLPSGTVVLDISHNKIQSLPDAFLLPPERDSTSADGSSMIVELRANDNRLRSLPRSIGRFTMLQVLECGRNRLEGNALDVLAPPAETSDAGAHGCLLLRELDASRNELTHLPVHIGRLVALRRLDVRENRLSCLPASISQCAELCELYVGANRLVELCEEHVDGGDGRRADWKEMRSLKMLDVSQNKLTALPESIVNLPSLSVLDVSNNDITRLPLSIGKMRGTLRKLVLHGNAIRSIRRELLEGETVELMKYLSEKLEKSVIFGETPSAEDDFERGADGDRHGVSRAGAASSRPNVTPVQGRLTLVDDKNVRSMPILLQYAHALTHIDIHGNAIEVVDPEDARAIACSMPQLVELNLGRNRISHWPFRDVVADAASADGMGSSLRYINISFNSPSLVLPSPSARGLGLSSLFPKLVHLDLSGCTTPTLAQHIDSDVSRLGLLEELYLMQCALVDFPSSLIRRGSRLQRLSLASNAITVIPEDMTVLRNLKSLDISNNDISRLPPSLGLMDESLVTLLVEGNPLRTIRRTVVMKGTRALLEYLRNKLPEPP